jgi:hypothetical protein
MTRTILGFDSWTGGAGKYASLVPALRRRGIRLVLLHIGSWGADRGRPVQEFVDDLEIRDIAWYKGKGFEEILRIEQPIAVLMLSNDVFAHRAFNRYSLAAGIPTFRLYHGLVNVQAIGDAGLFKVNLISQMHFVLVRLPKALGRIWPCYIRALVRTGASLKDWWRFFTDTVNLTRGHYIAHAAPDCRTTKTAVYTQADVGHAVEKYGHLPEDVYVVGNPDIAMFNLDESCLGYASINGHVATDEIIYIDTGLIYAGMVFDGPDDYYAHLIETRDSLARQGKRMAIKLHPHHFRTNFPARLEAADVEILSNANFTERLTRCGAALVEPSTAALIPGLLGVPVMLVRYGKFARQVYGKVMVTYPRARHLDDPDLLQSMLDDEIASHDADAVRRWIDENAGPLPADHMPERVAEILDAMSCCDQDF